MTRSEDSPSAGIFATNRLEALSDGVFAIVMTILVLEISIPLITEASANTELMRELAEMWPKFFAYVLSFLVLGVMWVNHHFMFHHIKRANNKLAWLNILFLMFVALVPFSTSLLGEYSNTQTAVVAYGVNVILILVAGFTLWSYVTGKYRLVDDDIDPKIVKRTKIMFVVGFFYFLVAMGVSFISPIAAFCIYGLMALTSIVSSWLGEQGLLSKVLVRRGKKPTPRGE
jgi:uncharacterized membrane protein